MEREVQGDIHRQQSLSHIPGVLAHPPRMPLPNPPPDQAVGEHGEEGVGGGQGHQGRQGVADGRVNGVPGARAKEQHKARNPSDMATEWDRRIRSIKGFKVLEGERERKMAMELADQLAKHDRVLAVIDTMRVAGILELLTKEM